jgi:hypothetical protein
MLLSLAEVVADTNISGLNQSRSSLVQSVLIKLLFGSASFASASRDCFYPIYFYMFSGLFLTALNFEHQKADAETD